MMTEDLLLETSLPEELIRSRVLMHQLLRQALEQGQTGMVSTLLELSDACSSVDFLIVQYHDRIAQLEDALSVLLSSIENARGERLSSHTIKRLLAPVSWQIKKDADDMETLN